MTPLIGTISIRDRQPSVGALQECPSMYKTLGRSTATPTLHAPAKGLSPPYPSTSTATAVVASPSHAADPPAASPAAPFPSPPLPSPSRRFGLAPPLAPRPAPAAAAAAEILSRSILVPGRSDRM
eukprot:scaffold2321_cov87-Isochrysis_galbana.AAC.1